jgi:hypothetical protein
MKDAVAVIYAYICVNNAHSIYIYEYNSVSIFSHLKL